MIVMPLWLWLVIFAIAGVVALVTLPSRRRAAKKRESEFSEQARARADKARMLNITDRSSGTPEKTGEAERP